MGSTDISNTEMLNTLMKCIQDESKKTKEDKGEQIKLENQKLIQKLEVNQIAIDTLTNKVNGLETKFKQLDKSYRKNNIIIFGLVISEDKHLSTYTLQSLSQLLDITLQEGDINNLYKLKGDNIPPIKVEFTSYLRKELVIRQANKLKGTNVYIAHDLSPEDRLNQKVLRKHLKEARERHYSAKIKGSILLVNGEAYTVEQLKQLENQGNDTIETTGTVLRNLSNSAPQTPTKPSESDELIEHNILKQQEKDVQSLDITQTVLKLNKAHIVSNKEEVVNIPSGSYTVKRTNTSPADAKKEEAKKKVTRTNSTSDIKTDVSARVTRQQFK